MKNQFLILLFTVCGTVSSYSQILSNFTVQNYETGVYVEWTIDSGYTCTGLTLQHSNDSINFRDIYEYPGVCGSISSPETYSFVHTSPIDYKANFYRLDLGINGYSDVLKVLFLNLKEKGYVVERDHATGTSKLMIHDVGSGVYCFDFYSLSGQKLNRHCTNKTEVELNMILMPNSYYLFRAISPFGKIISGSFVLP